MPYGLDRVATLVQSPHLTLIPVDDSDRLLIGQSTMSIRITKSILSLLFASSPFRTNDAVKPPATKAKSARWAQKGSNGVLDGLRQEG